MTPAMNRVAQVRSVLSLDHLIATDSGGSTIPTTKSETIFRYFITSLKMLVRCALGGKKMSTVDYADRANIGGWSYRIL